MEMLNKIANVFGLNVKRHHSNDVVEKCDTKYCAVINDNPTFFDTKDAMLKGIEEFSRFNTVYSLNMFRYDMFNLLK